MKYVNRRFMGQSTVVVCLCGLGLWHIGLGQDISVVQEEADRRGMIVGLSPSSSYTSQLLDLYGLVADGEFYALPESTPEELRALKPEEVVVRFRIRKLYKGLAADSINIRMNKDMLAFPDEDISRGVKRQQIIAKQNEDLEPLWQQYRALESAYKAEEIAESEFWAEAAKIMKLIKEREARDGVSSAGLYLVMDGFTFYDIGGVIRAGEKYLIGVNPIEEGADVYSLTEFGGSLIYWGEMREYVRSGFIGTELQSQPR